MSLSLEEVIAKRKAAMERIEEEFALIRFLGNRGCVDSAMLNVKPLSDIIDQLLAEVQDLRDRVLDHEDDIRAVLSEACAPDEKHCACVPALRGRIAELEGHLASSAPQRLMAALEVQAKDAASYESSEREFFPLKVQKPR